MFINDTENYSQHFLIDEDIMKKFINFMNLKENDFVVEIGPGKGILTQMIAQKVQKVLAIEVDRKLAIFLDKLNKEKIDVIYGNALDLFIPKCNKIVSSLPYNITEPFIEKLLKCEFEECTLIVGQKFAKAITSNKISKLSLLCSCFFSIEYLLDIDNQAFFPVPRVSSTIIRIKKIKANEITDQKLKIFREIFYERSKKFKNSFQESLILNKKITQKEAKKIIDDLKFNDIILNKNIENLSNEDYVKIYDKISEIL